MKKEQFFKTHYPHRRNHSGEIIAEKRPVRKNQNYLLISSGGCNVIPPAGNFCDQMPGLFRQLSKIFKNILSFKQFSLLMLFSAKKWVFWKPVFVWFSDEINFEKLKKSPRKHQQGGDLEIRKIPRKKCTYLPFFLAEGVSKLLPLFFQKAEFHRRYLYHK